MYPGYITDIEDILVGHAEYKEGITGVTVIICENGAVCGVDVRGAAPGTRETDLLKTDKTIEKVHAIVLSGGSAFGLDSCTGVMKYLEEKGIGFDVGVAKVPIVCGAVLFDLGIGSSEVRPDKELGYIAASNASKGETRQGNIGAGMGATVGKILGMENSIKSGIGSATVKCGDLTVSAITAVNAFGDVFDYSSHSQIAGAYDYKTKKLLETNKILKSYRNKMDFRGLNTTISVVATNAKLEKYQCNSVAKIAHNGYVKTINPVHTSFDGDTIFVMSAGEIESDFNLISQLAIEAVGKSVNNGIYHASSTDNIKAYNDIMKQK